MYVQAFNLSTSGPADVSQLETLIQQGTIHPADVVCIIGKTEGNGGRNDFTRDLAMYAFEDLFARHLGLSRAEVTQRIIFSLSGGCEGVVTPHIVVFTRAGTPQSERRSAKRLAIGTGFTREFRPEEIGRIEQVVETSRVIHSIMEGMHLDSPKDVHFIQMKGAIPSFTYEDAQSALAEGRPLRSDMVYSRGASALGAALAVGEVDLLHLTDDSICQDWSKFSSVASCSAKPGLTRTEIMVMGNSAFWDGTLVINHGVLHDMLDVQSVRSVLNQLGFTFDMQLTPDQAADIIGVFAKSEADPRGMIRGHRHTMLTDDDISDTRYSRCVLSSVLASILGKTSVYISTRAEHHGPSGGGTLSIIAQAQGQE